MRGPGQGARGAGVERARDPRGGGDTERSPWQPERDAADQTPASERGRRVTGSGSSAAMSEGRAQRSEQSGPPVLGRAGPVVGAAPIPEGGGGRFRPVTRPDR